MLKSSFQVFCSTWFFIVIPVVVLDSSLKDDGGGESNLVLHRLLILAQTSVCPCTVMSLSSEKGIAAKMHLLCCFACWHMSVSSHVLFLFC